MKSDLESLKETGGAPPVPKPFTPPELKREYQPPTPPPPPPPPKITPADFGQPQKMEAPKPAAPAPITAPIIEEESKRSSRKLLVWGGALVIVVGVGLLGYFVLFPLLFPTQTPPPAPAITTPTPEQPPAEIPGEITQPTPEPLLHQALFSSDRTSMIQLPTVDRIAFLAMLQQEAQKTNPTGTLVEVGMNDLSGQFPAGNLFAMLLPLESESLGGIFEPDFTAALYFDADGAWPIYAFKVNLESSVVEAQAAIKGLENSQALANFFLADPGTPNAAGFKDGQANGLPTRYLTYSKRGAALNLAWSGDKLVVSTSYNGLRKALTNLK
jgi:hypothetical protein